MPIFSSSLRLAFLVFESMRQHLKFQLEYYMTNLINIVVNENSKIPYGKKEMALSMFNYYNKIQILPKKFNIWKLIFYFYCRMSCPTMENPRIGH